METDAVHHFLQPGNRHPKHSDLVVCNCSVCERLPYTSMLCGLCAGHCCSNHDTSDGSSDGEDDTSGSDEDGLKTILCRQDDDNNNVFDEINYFYSRLPTRNLFSIGQSCECRQSTVESRCATINFFQWHFFFKFTQLFL